MENFMSLVYPEPNTGCWIWGGRYLKGGYGFGSFSLNIQLAHRYSFWLINGPFDLTLCVLHKCDNRYCVNPDHLFLGTKGDNNRDRDAKGRAVHVHGEDQYLSKLTEETVRQIRASWKFRVVTVNHLAEKFGVSYHTIRHVLRRESWKHVE